MNRCLCCSVLDHSTKYIKRITKVYPQRNKVNIILIEKWIACRWYNLIVIILYTFYSFTVLDIIAKSKRYCVHTNRMSSQTKMVNILMRNESIYIN